jgi:NAD(P)H-nitrite reductase large subunit
MKVVIIGNGIAGSTAARFVRKMGNHEITMISDESKFPFSRTALMYIYMGHLTFNHTKLYEDSFWDKNRIQLLQDRVSSLELDNKKIILASGQLVFYDKLIIACGSKSNKFGWPGQDLENVNGLYHFQDLEKMERASTFGINRAVIVGGGLIGLEMAEMFHSRHIPVTLLVRENSFWNIVLPAEESEMINNHIRSQGIDLRLNVNLKQINGVNGKVTAVVLENGSEIACEYVGLTVGVSPNIEFLKSSGLEFERGIVVNEYLQTSNKDVFAIGDCAQLKNPAFGRRNIEAVWYTGRNMGQIAAANVCDRNQKYEQGIWFNSAKFFDIEYQVYGYVPTQMDDKVESIFWQNELHNKSIRLIFEKGTKALVGVNLMGVRYRHEVCEKWIQNKTSVEDVLQDLSLANFDPEFFEEYEDDIIALYNRKYNAVVKRKSARKLSLVSKFLKSII